MKKMTLVLSLTLLFLGCKKEVQENISEEMQTEESAENQFRQEALSQELLSIDRNVVTFDDVLNRHKGKPILIDVWASWCPDCIEGMPKVHDLQNQFKDVIYLFLSYDKTEESWKNGIEKYKTIGENFLIHSDWKGGEFRKAIDLDWIPRYILIDQNGKIAHYRAIEADDQELITKIKELTK